MTILRDGKTLYELNEQGTNIWWATVQSPPEKAGGCAKRAEEIAHKMQYVEELERAAKLILQFPSGNQRVAVENHLYDVLRLMESTND